MAKKLESLEHQMMMNQEVVETRLAKMESWLASNSRCGDGKSVGVKSSVVEAQAQCQAIPMLTSGLAAHDVTPTPVDLEQRASSTSITDVGTVVVKSFADQINTDKSHEVERDGWFINVSKKKKKKSHPVKQLAGSADPSASTLKICEAASKQSSYQSKGSFSC